MKPRFSHHSEALVAVPDTGGAPAAERVPEPAPEFRACCCPGRPVVRVIMPASATRPHPVDLLLCGHHYRASCAAPAAARAVIINDRRSGGTIVTEYELGVRSPANGPIRSSPAGQIRTAWVCRSATVTLGPG